MRQGGSQLACGNALLDLFDPVQIVNTAKSRNDLMLVASITHTLTPNSWLMDLGFAGPESAEVPLVVAKAK